MLARFRSWIASIFTWPQFDEEIDFDPAPPAPTLRQALLIARLFVEEEFKSRGDDDGAYQVPAGLVLMKIDAALAADEARRLDEEIRFSAMSMSPSL